MTAKKKHQVIRRSTRRVPIATDSVKLSSSERELLAIPRSEWEMAKRQERIVKAAIRTSVEKAADQAGRSTSKPLSLGVFASKAWASCGKSATRSGTEAIVEEAIDKWMASREPLPVSRAVEEAVRLTKAAGLKSIARNSITRRPEMRGGGAYQRSPKERQLRPDIPKTRRALAGSSSDAERVDSWQQRCRQEHDH
jgi:hypothetical protein